MQSETRFLPYMSASQQSLFVAHLLQAVASLRSAHKTIPLVDNQAKDLESQLRKICQQLDILFGTFDIGLQRPIKPSSQFFPPQTTSTTQSNQLIYCSPAMQNLMKLAERAASSEAPVLITGETGVGKELIARMTHLHSSRRHARFVPVNCTAIPRELFETYFFGYKQGAFTGANRNQAGIIRAAAGGTLFLDEIGDLPLEIQPKLLRFLQDLEIQPVGDSFPLQVDVRIIAATNSSLEEAVAGGRFRSDLFYRLNIISLEVPPLRHRREDIPVLINFFLNKYAATDGNTCIRLTPEALSFLIEYDWPGNVRELSNVIQRLVSLADSEACISISDLPPALTQRKVKGEGSDATAKDEVDLHIPAPYISSSVTLAEAVEMLERRQVREALIRNEWNFAKAARQLGLSTFGLRKKYRRLFPQESSQQSRQLPSL